MSPPKETRIVAGVLAWLNRQRGVYAWRNNTGAAVIRGRVVHFGTPGSADILACITGRFVAIECKTETGTQSPLQKRWQESIEACGGEYYLVRSVEEAQRLVLVPSPR